MTNMSPHFIVIHYDTRVSKAKEVIHINVFFEKVYCIISQLYLFLERSTTYKVHVYITLIFKNNPHIISQKRTVYLHHNKQNELVIKSL
jgi:hypothetical protein